VKNKDKTRKGPASKADAPASKSEAASAPSDLSGSGSASSPAPVRAPAPAGDAPRAATAAEPTATTVWGRMVAFARRHPFAVALTGVILFALAVYVPMAGSYGLWDPWETHYGEVARRMVHENDYLFTRWQNESFRSKPPLTFWIMSAGMKAFGIGGTWGGGDFAHSAVTEWAIRLPFVLFGVFGIAMAFTAIARLVSLRAGLIAAAVLTTTPFYFFLARHAITDMPACALLVGGLSCYLLAIYSKDAEQPLPVWFELGPFKVTPLWLFLGVLGAFMLPQFIHFWQFALKFPARPIFFPLRIFGARIPIHTNTTIIMAITTAFFVGLVAWTVLVCKTRRHVWLFFFYFLNGMGVLAKVYPPLESGLIILCFLIVSGDWKILLRSSIGWGIVCVLVVALPWHIGMYQRDGQPWSQEYFIHHLLKRTASGVHGDRGTFEYFLQQLGVGMWPWVALVPAALIRAVAMPRPAANDVRGKVRLFLACWAVGTFAFYSLMLTKFHHYILPCVPALMLLVGLFLDDLIAGKARGTWLAGALGMVIFGFVARDFVWNQQRFIHLFVYNYGRAWPFDYGLDFRKWLLLFAVLAAIPMLALLWTRARRAALYATFAVAIGFTYFSIDHYLIKISPHWSQKYLINTYYDLRKDSSEKLIAWQMNWRGENFYSKSEIWDYVTNDPDDQTVFMQVDNTQIQNYLKTRAGHRYFVITEKGRVDGLRGALRALPDAMGTKASDSFQIVDESSNKFTLVAFEI